MATLEMLRSLPRAPSSVPISNLRPITSFGGDGGSDDEKPNRNPDLQNYFDAVYKNAVESVENQQKEALKKLLDDENNRRDYRCIFVNSRTQKRCTSPKREGSVYCKKHKGYVKRREKTDETRKMSSEITKQKNEISKVNKDLKEKQVLLSKHAEVIQRVKDMKNQKHEIDDRMLEYKTSSLKTFNQIIEEDDIIPEEVPVSSKEEVPVSSKEEVLKRKKKKKTSEKPVLIEFSENEKETSSEEEVLERKKKTSKKPSLETVDVNDDVPLKKGNTVKKQKSIPGGDFFDNIEPPVKKVKSTKNSISSRGHQEPTDSPKDSQKVDSDDARFTAAFKQMELETLDPILLSGSE